MKIGCYARGGGLGHLTRVRAALHTLYPGEVATIVTDSPFALDERVIGPHVVRTAIEPDLDVLIVDAFPAGLRGELTAASVPSGVVTVHLARMLRWDAYAPLLPASPLRFDHTWLVETCSASHIAYLRSVSDELADLSLVDPPAEGLDADGAWLIVHAGPDDEVRELVAYARELASAEGVRPRFVLVAPSVPAGVEVSAHVAAWPAWPLYASADRVVTAAGFNAVRQLRPWRAKHRMLPFARRFDDQFRRAALARAEGDGAATD